MVSHDCIHQGYTCSRRVGVPLAGSPDTLGQDAYIDAWATRRNYNLSTRNCRAGLEAEVSQLVFGVTQALNGVQQVMCGPRSAKGDCLVT